MTMAKAILAGAHRRLHAGWTYTLPRRAKSNRYLRRARQSDSVHILINLFVALVLLNLTFLTNEYVANTGNLIGCKLMAGFMHYCLLTSFTWFGLEALHLCLQLGRNSTPIKHYLTKICIAGWAPPAVVVTVVFCLQKYNQLVIRTDNGKDVKMCWINDSTVHYVVNIGYYSVIFAFTFVTFVIMLRWIFLLKGTAANQHKSLAGSGKRTTDTSDALTVMGLCCTLGLTWGFAFFAYGALRLPSYYIFTILNSFQGFFLFIYYYKTSKLVGDQMTSENTSTTTEATSVENPPDGFRSRVVEHLKIPVKPLMMPLKFSALDGDPLGTGVDHPHYSHQCPAKKFRQRGGRRQYLVDWMDYGPDSHLVRHSRACPGGHLKGRPKKGLPVQHLVCCAGSREASSSAVGGRCRYLRSLAAPDSVEGGTVTPPARNAFPLHSLFPADSL
ncbi:hypothetical protein AOLI_G00040620 [Acnodon oligacanthus]